MNSLAEDFLTVYKGSYRDSSAAKQGEREQLKRIEELETLYSLRLYVNSKKGWRQNRSKLRPSANELAFWRQKIGPGAGSVYPLEPHLQSPYSPESAGLLPAVSELLAVSGAL